LRIAVAQPIAFAHDPTSRDLHRHYAPLLRYCSRSAVAVVKAAPEADARPGCEGATVAGEEDRSGDPAARATGAYADDRAPEL
jgi:hypothetical protein